MSSSNEGGFFATNKNEIVKQNIDSDIDETLKCMFCNSSTINNECYNIFSISVCNKCRYSKLNLTTKTQAKNNYLLDDFDLKNLKYIKRPNPHKKHGEMHLMLSEEVEAIAKAKFGDLEVINKFKNERVDKLMNSRKKKMAKKLAELKRKTKGKMKDEKHKHEFVVKDGVCECKCGLKYKENKID